MCLKAEIHRCARILYIHTHTRPRSPRVEMLDMSRQIKGGKSTSSEVLDYCIDVTRKSVMKENISP